MGPELPFYLIGVLLIGFLAGFLSGLLGIGGGIVMVPGLFFLLTRLGYGADTAMHVAVGTSLAVIFFASLSSSLAHARHKALDYSLVKRWAPWAVLGVALALAIANHVNGIFITWVFAGFLLFVSLHLTVTGDLKQRRPIRLPESLQPVLGLAIGAFSSLLGIGGAMISIPAMLMFRVSVHTAIGTAPVFGVLIAFFGALGSIIIGGKQQGLPPWSLGYVNLAGLILMAPAGYIAAPVGAKLIHRMPVEKLQRLFAGILFMVAAWLFYELITLNG